jgi:hypothetical protein
MYLNKKTLLDDGVDMLCVCGDLYRVERFEVRPTFVDGLLLLEDVHSTTAGMDNMTIEDVIEDMTKKLANHSS